MSEIPAELRYTESHEWVQIEDEGMIRIGVSDHAQAELGDLVYVELPEAGTQFSAGDACAVVESVKAASDIYSPLTGEVVEVNENLADDPGLVNSDPYNDGWLFTLRLDDREELENLLDADGYSDLLHDI